MAFTKAERDAITGGLSRPSKMPGPAYSIPAAECKTGSKLREISGSTCAKCYACKGRYLFANVQKALYRRLAAIDHPDWVRAMAESIDGHPWFRWHDSGDIQSRRHFARMLRIARRTPETRHWIPTREASIVRHATVPANVVVRVSAPMVGAAPPKGYAHTSTVDSGIGHRCPASTQGNQCGDCRACWDPEVANVDYPLH